MESFEVKFPDLGHGAFAVCYRVIRKRDKKLGCLKVSNEIYDPVAKKQVEEEFRFLQDLKHPNVIEAYEGFWDSDRFCVFMELAEGDSLRKQIGKKLGEEEILRLLTEIAQGLEYIHKLKIMHRDLKPENILLDSKGKVKICDFGLSRTLDQSIQASVTLAGTPCYIAPELWEGDEAGFSSDVWSLGIIIYELCVGCPPFQGSTPLEVAKAIKTKLPPPLPSSFSIVLSDLYTSMLLKRPRLRPKISTILYEINPSFVASDSSTINSFIIYHDFLQIF